LFPRPKNDFGERSTLFRRRFIANENPCCDWSFLTKNIYHDYYIFFLIIIMNAQVLICTAVQIKIIDKFTRSMQITMKLFSQSG